LRMLGSLLALHLTYVGFVGMLIRELPVIDGARVADPGLRMAVRAALNKPLLPVTEADMRSVTKLDAIYHGVTTLDGVSRALPNLETIRLEPHVYPCLTAWLFDPERNQEPDPWWHNYVRNSANQLPGEVAHRPENL